jgi:hypothetical protein
MDSAQLENRKESAMFNRPIKNNAPSVLGKSIKRSISIVLATLVTFGCVATTFAGGFQLSAEVPESASAHKLKDAVLFVRTYGCHQPADAAVSAAAEGVVNGERRSLPIELVYDSTGVYGIKQQWPSEGSWILAITGEYNGMTSTLIIDLGANGKVHSNTRLNPGERKGPHARMLQRKPTTAEIDSALKAVTGNISLLPSDTFTEKSTSRTGALIVSGMGAFLFVVGFVTLSRRRRSRQAAAENKQ